MMRVVIVGAGAMGCLFGARLALAGHDVALVDVRRDHLAAIRRHGLRWQSPAGEQTVTVAALTPDEASGAADLVIFFTRALHTGAAVAGVAALLQTAAPVALTVQSGLGNLEAVADAVPPERIVAGATTVWSRLSAPGTIFAAGAGTTCIDGACPAARPHAEAVGRLLAAAGFAVEVTPRALDRHWTGAIVTACLSALTVLTRLPPAVAAGDPSGADLLKHLVDEALAVARAEGRNLDRQAVVTAVAAACDPDKPAGHLTALLDDLLAGRPTEIDHLSGALAGRAADHGLAAPLHSAVTQAVQLMQRHRDRILTGR